MNAIGPPTRRTRASIEAERRKLAAWWAEWDLSLHFKDMGEPLEKPLPPAADRLSRPLFDRYGAKPPKPGEIHLLAPLKENDDRPLYMLVLSVDSGAEQAWIPFSFLATPATPLEWRTGWRARPLQVLAFWNARRVISHRWPNGWRTGRLTPTQRARVQQIHNAFQRDGQLHDTETDRIGPPLLHPADPRHAYMLEERERVDLHLDFPTGLKGQQSERGPYILENLEDSHHWLLAAERRAAYGVAVRKNKD